MRAEKHVENHSHKKRKDCMEDSLDQVLFAAELEFLKILVLGLPQNKSNIKTEYAGKYNCIFMGSASWSTNIFILLL